MLHIPPPHGNQHAGHPLRCLRGDQQVHMIGHEHVGVQFASCLGERFLQPMQVALVIRLAKEARLAIVAALHDMQGQAIKV